MFLLHFLPFLGFHPTIRMIRCVLIVNDSGKPRLVRFYDESSFDEQQVVIKEAFSAVSGKETGVVSGCCFVSSSTKYKTIFRHFASLYFIVIANECESELGILDLLQVFVHVLDKCFDNICELDIVYRYERVNYVLDEIIMGGMVLETNTDVIMSAISG